MQGKRDGYLELTTRPDESSLIWMDSKRERENE